MKIESFQGEHRFLSNFWPAEVEYDGVTYPSVEHAYVAAKTTDRKIREEIRDIEYAGCVKRFGRKIEIRSDWDSIKLSVMENLVRQKFSNHKDLKEKLLSTGDSEIVEGNTWGDTFWGVCKGKGENHLGRILMKIRKELFEND